MLDMYKMGHVHVHFFASDSEASALAHELPLQNLTFFWILSSNRVHYCPRDIYKLLCAADGLAPKHIPATRC